MGRIATWLASLCVTCLACTEVRKTCVSTNECHEDFPTYICEEWDAKMLNDARWKASDMRCEALGFKHTCAERLYTREAKGCGM